VGTMRDMVDAFRNYARPPKLRREQLDLNRLINETLDLYRSMDASAHIATELAPLPPVHADASRIRQVFNNLLDNAFDAGLEGSAPHLQISSRLLREGGADSVELRFRDAGRGLGGGSPDRLFEPYVTTKAKGTGLGLAIVRKNVEDHSGIVWLEENRDAPGVCVVIRLPIARPAVPAAPTRVSADTAAVS